MAVNTTGEVLSSTLVRTYRKTYPWEFHLKSELATPLYKMLLIFVILN